MASSAVSFLRSAGSSVRPGLLLIAFGFFLGLNIRSVLKVTNSTGAQYRLEAEYEQQMNDGNADGLKKKGALILPPLVIPDTILKELSELSGGDSIRDLECPPPLLPFYDRVVAPNNPLHANETTGTARKIPRIMHLSMQSRCLPRDLHMFMDRWKVQFPDYSIFFHDDAAVNRLINQEWAEFPGLHRAMLCVKYKGAMTIDVWRVLILYKYGGIYSDIDNWATDNFNETVIEPDLSAFFFSDTYARPSQWFMATEPRHPMMHMAMMEIISNIFNIGHIFKPKTVFVTGPGAVKNAYALFHHEEAKEDRMHIFESGGGMYIGMHGKKTKKIGKGTSHFLISKYKYKDIVPFNATLNVTRGERIDMESGVAHWAKQRHWKSKDKKTMAISCKKYLQKLDDGWVGP